MTRIIVVSSGKGGVGKTTLVANLAAALADYGKKVVAVDCNLTTSNLGLHLGIPLYPVTLQDVLGRRARIKDAMYYHTSGFRVVPADISLSRKFRPKTHELIDTFYKLVGDADFVLIDSAAGLGPEAEMAVEAADEAIIVTNPELPALTDALKLKKLAESHGTKNVGVVLNRVKGESNEIETESVEAFMDLPLLGVVPEDRRVRDAIANKQPVYVDSPKSRAALHFKQIAARLIGEEFEVRKPLTSRLFAWLR
jgi:septum site-determining protein MinD